MSEENKISLVRAAAKLKRAKKNRPTSSDGGSDNKSRGVDNRRETNEGFASAVVGLVHKLKRD